VSGVQVLRVAVARILGMVWQRNHQSIHFCMEMRENPDFVPTEAT
jgi:hypothetical protein